MSSELGFIQRLTRAYTFHSPIRKGKYRLALASLGARENLPKQLTVETRDGRSLRTNFDNDSAYFLYFLGEYEPAITGIIEKLVKPGDVCFDIGGNIGWYTTLLQKLVGPSGEVHAFEPVPRTFEMLRENVESNVNSSVVKLNNFALGEEEGTVSINLFDDLPDGHASIADFGIGSKTTFKCRVRTLNDYLVENDVRRVDFVKIDIEGAELMMLKGAAQLFELDPAPVFEIEMALDTTKGFNYYPNDILEFIKTQGDFRFFAIDDLSADLTLIDKFEENDRGANVLCVPKGRKIDLPGFK